ncbi:MAG: methylenetetrahydrofolate--tRNA-(uracil(54)-C(5))-methyltransferase (FADH(2)-oxidizing) TrmFO, partial [Candidatus Krumholzibacteria bacterium]|nr:methylenetetrahydrofolate--tRNA-(uracil(54)-C(5))-methyltransferase (FADH(2)-oxidizing) TrmFO [Candidatus Krumholzibacteria bacterium]
MLGCFLLEAAAESRVQAGHALAVDREMFSRAVTSRIEAQALIKVLRFEQKDLDLGPCSVIATGPLTSNYLSKAISDHFSSEHLYFYDAISISVSAESIDPTWAYKASRYGKGGDDYWNIPLDRDQYGRLVDFLRSAPKAEKHGFEETRCFESCLPVEVIAARGFDALRFGPLKPKGLVNPTTLREPHAVLQLRQETMDGTLYGLVGFQTRLTRKAQEELLSVLPGFRAPEILRWGSVHRNTFLDSPRILDEMQMSRKCDGLFFAGQMVGVEGYVESIGHGVIVARNVVQYLEGRRAALLPRETLVGSLQRHCVEGRSPFQPMNANFGILPPIKARRTDRRKEYVKRSLECLDAHISRLEANG